MSSNSAHEIPVDGNGLLLEGKAIVKNYPTPKGKLTVLDGANIKVERGEVLAIMGASGSGKSTLLHVLGALDKIDSGRVMLDGRDLAALSETARADTRNRRIGFIFQFYHLFADFNALENVLMPARIGRFTRGAGKRKMRERAKELLGRVGLGDRMHHRPFELSGGEQQRVAIARALINGPEIILADEPSGNLDPETGKLIHELLASLSREYNQTMVVVTHNPGLVDMCSRAMYLVDGEITRNAPRGFR